MSKTIKKQHLKRKAGKKSKRVVKKNLQKRLKENKNRRNYGGAKYLSGETDLAKIYNALLYKKGKDGKDKVNFQFKNTQVGDNKKKVLFVIDMQNDFLDMPYERTHGDLNPILGSMEGIGGGPNAKGNFDVADGQKMVAKNSEFMTFIETAIHSDDYKHVFFSRDYHPVGHKSFSIFFKESPILLCKDCKTEDDLNSRAEELPDGIFPAHCVQGFNGTLFNKDIEEILTNYASEKDDDKVQIVFKGIHKEADSFTAVNFSGNEIVIDHIASNNNGNCKGCSNTCSGSYKIKDGNLLSDITFNNEVVENDIDDVFQKIDYTTIIDDEVEVIEVCGLAGDYCVRDTIVALEKMFTDKKIVLLGDFTRYACLPFSTIMNIPVHINGPKERVPKDSNNILDIEEIEELNGTDIKEFFLNKVTEKNSNKDIRYYLIHYDFKDRKLFTADEASKENIDIFDFNLNKEHFITPHSAILRDYAKENIYIQITEPNLEHASEPEPEHIMNKSAPVAPYMKSTFSSENKITPKYNNPTQTLKKAAWRGGKKTRKHSRT